MNTTPVKETARQTGPHMLPRKITDPVTASYPQPGCQNLVLTISGGFTASGLFDPSQIMSTSIEVDLVVSTADPSTRLVQGTMRFDTQEWYCDYAPGDFPQPGDARMPAVLIVRGQTMQGGTVIVYVPFCYDPSLAPKR